MTSQEQGHEVETPRITSVVHGLVAINIAVYFVQLSILRPVDVKSALGFQSHNLGHQWWTIGTYMFVHGSPWLLALNMYALWVFGPRVERRWTSREFLRYYLFCGLGGWFAHLAFVPGDTLLTGASAAVFGVMLAYATLWPAEQMFVFGVVPTTVRWFVLFLVALNLVGGLATTDGISGMAYIVHLGGLLAGWLYLRTTAAVNLGRLRQGVSPVPDEPEDGPPRAVPRALPRSRAREREHIDDVVARSNAVVTKRTLSRRVSRGSPSEHSALNCVLDKISAHGLNSLTGAERKLLDEASKRLRDE